MLSSVVLGGLQGGVRRAACFLAFWWGLAALCGAQVASGQQPSTAPPDSDSAFSAAGIGTGTRAMTGLWQLHLGDDMAWAQPGFDDHTWEQLPADQPWGDVGHPGYAGYAWYRRQIALDPNNKEPLALLLPPLGSAAEVYWNGVKVGGIGTLPPRADWPFLPAPAAVPLPSKPGARSGELAIRLWQHRWMSGDAPDAGGFQAALRLGYGPVIEATPQQWWEHRVRTHVIPWTVLLGFLFVATAAFALWIRSSSQWLLLATAGYLGVNGASAFMGTSAISFVSYQVLSSLGAPLVDVAFISLVLLVANLPSRSGVRGASLWWRASVVVLAIDCFSGFESVCEALMSPRDTHPFLFHFLDKSSEWLAFVYFLYVPVLLTASFLLSRYTLSRFLFLAAVSLNCALDILHSLLQQSDTQSREVPYSTSVARGSARTTRASESPVRRKRTLCPWRESTISDNSVRISAVFGLVVTAP